MLGNLKKIDNKLSGNYKKALEIGVCMLFLALIGGAIAYFLSYTIGHAVVLISAAIANICIFYSGYLVMTGRHLKKN
jgi:uncharacterized membrane protein (UPF0136 family)